MTEPIVFLPGMMCDARLFAPQIALLSKDHPVVVMPLTDKETMHELAIDILDNAPPSFALVGLSMGGIVAMEVIRQAPERVTRLALFDTNSKSEAIERAERRNHEIERIQNGELRAVIRDDMKPNYLADGDNRVEILELCMQMAESLGADVFVKQSRALQSRPDQCNSLKEVSVPTIIACGEADSLCPIERHQLMHQLIKHSQLHIISGAGHLPTLEQSDQVNQLLSDWLADS